MRIGSTALLSVLALVVAYLGIAIALVIITTNRDQRAVAGGMTYVLIAFGVPVLTGLVLHRRRQWDGLRAVRSGLVLLLLIHVALLPYAVAVFAM